MRELLTGGYDVDIDNKNEDERTPCHLAARHGHVEVLRLILEKDRNAIFDKDEDDNTPLHLAAKAKHSEAVDFLLCQGASVHKRSVELEKFQKNTRSDIKIQKYFSIQVSLYSSIQA